MNIRIIKKAAGILLIISIFAAMCACSDAKTENISLYDLSCALNEAGEFTDMKYASSNDDNPQDLFENISDMNYSKINGFFISYAANGTGNADEVACIQVKNKSDINEAVASLNAHLQRRIALYDTYDKSQSEKLSNAVVTSYGSVAVLIVGDKADYVKTAFNNFFGD